MSHFTVAVFEDPNGKELDDLLAPFSENLSVPHCIPKAEIIAKQRKRFEDYRDTRYAEYLADPDKYKLNCTNDDHIKYISEEFPQKFSWTDEDFYQEGIKYEEPENIRPDGSVYSEYNPNSKWDWYDIGGRWRNMLQLKNGEKADYDYVSEIDFDAMGEDFRTYAVLTPDGVWHAPGEMGWFGMSSESDDEYEDWKKNYRKKFIDTANPNWLMYIVDCHI